MDKNIFIIDPQSVGSLAAYDKCMLEGINQFNLFFFGNKANNNLPQNTNLKFYPIFKYNTFKFLPFKILSYLISLSIICYYGVKKKPAILHMQWIKIWNCDWLLIKFFKRFFNSKFFFTVHNLLPHTIRKNSKKQYTKIYEKADILIAHTETTKKDLIKEFGINPQKIIIMAHGILDVPVSENDFLKAKNNLENKYNFKNKLIFSSLGIQSYYKGQDLLVDAWMKNPLLNKNQNLILLIVGKKGDIKYTQKFSENIIHIDSKVSDAEFNYLMKRSDIIVLPYRRIEQSGVLLSIINESKPYCCTNVGELAKPFDIANIGWVIPEINSDSISQVLENIVNNKHEIETKKNNKDGWDKIKKDYSWNKSNQALLKAYTLSINNMPFTD